LKEGPNRDHFVNNKLGGAHKVDKFLATADDPDFIAKQSSAARVKLDLIQKMLADQKSKGKPLWLVGDGPSHADAVIFGWYAFSQMNPVVIKNVWEHEGLPLIHEWVKGVKGLIEAGELPKASL
jgi:glutathione S-transferase